MVVGHYIFIGGGSIRVGLEQVIDEYLAQGGVDYPIPKEYLVETQATPPATPLAKEPLRLRLPQARIETHCSSLFLQVGCAECDRVTYDLNYLKDKYPQLEAEVFDVEEQAALNEWLSDQYAIRETNA